MKQRLLFLGFLFLLACGAQAQLPKTDEEERIEKERRERNERERQEQEARRKSQQEKERRPAAVRPLASIRIQANHDFYFSLNDGEVERVEKNKPKTIKLDEDVHKLEFEEADSTGERIERYFKMTSAMIKRRYDTLYTVAFQKDLTRLLNPAAAVETVGSAPPPSQKAASPIQAVVDELQNNLVRFPAGTQKNYAGVEVAVPSLYISKYEVTQAQWQAVMGANKSIRQNCPDCPVENVSWKEATDFVEKLNTGSKIRFRLPTSAEWDFVLGQVLQREIEGHLSPADYATSWQTLVNRTSWYNKAREGTQAVGKKDPAGGVYDLFGNVAEWCADTYSAATTNGGGARTNAEKKIIRGGSFEDKAEALQTKAPVTELASGRRKSLGFRLVSEAN